MGSIYLLCLTCRLRRLTVWSLIFLGGFISFSNYRVCVDFSGSFYFFLISVPFLGSWLVTTEGVRVSWTSMYVCMYGHHIKQSMDQPGKVANPARGQLNRENNIPLSPCVPENLVSRDGFSRPVPRQPAHLLTQAESGASLRDSSRVPRRRPFMKPPYAVGSVPSLSGHAIAYRWRSLPRARRHRASKPQGSSERVLPWQITMDQLIFASLSHTHYWYEVGLLKVPAVTDVRKY